MSLYFYEGYDGENEVHIRSALFDNLAGAEQEALAVQDRKVVSVEFYEVSHDVPMAREGLVRCTKCKGLSFNAVCEDCEDEG